MPVSSTPILIDPVKLDDTGVNFYGPYSVPGALYVVISETVGPNLEATVFKSVDDGATWVAQDSAATTNNGIYIPLFESSTIYLIYAHLGAPNVLGNVRFDIGSDSFLPAVETTISHTLVTQQVAVIRGDGSIFAGYVISDASIDALYYNIFSGGAWATEALLFQGLATELLNGLGAVVDGSDTTHFLFNHNVAAVDTPKYLTIDAGGSVSGEVTVPIANFGTVPKASLLWSGELVFSFLDPSDSRGYVAFAAGASTNPGTASWTTEVLWTTLAPASTDISPFLILNGSDLVVFFVNTDVLSVPSDVYYVVWNGSGFNPPVKFYDSIAYPPPGTAGNVSEFLLSLALNSGAYQMVFGASYGVGQPGTFFATDGGGAQSGYRNRVY